MKNAGACCNEKLFHCSVFRVQEKVRKHDLERKEKYSEEASESESSERTFFLERKLCAFSSVGRATDS